MKLNSVQPTPGFSDDFQKTKMLYRYPGSAVKKPFERLNSPPSFQVYSTSSRPVQESAFTASVPATLSGRRLTAKDSIFVLSFVLKAKYAVPSPESIRKLPADFISSEVVQTLSGRYKQSSLIVKPDTS